MFTVTCASWMAGRCKDSCETTVPLGGWMRIWHHVSAQVQCAFQVGTATWLSSAPDQSIVSVGKFEIISSRTSSPRFDELSQVTSMFRRSDERDREACMVARGCWQAAVAWVLGRMLKPQSLQRDAEMSRVGVCKFTCFHHKLGSHPSRYRNVLYLVVDPSSYGIIVYSMLYDAR